MTLMTLHNAKGLEFPIVFMIGMEDGVFPHSRALDEGSLEEERRLAYVGITRAMRDLTLTYARRRNVVRRATSSGVRSRFLDEIPRELTDQAARGRAPAAGAPGRVASWAGAAAASAEAQRGTARAAVFRIGDDVVHAAFGDGVVIGAEPGGIVVVRFAGDGSRAQADGRLRADPPALTSPRRAVASPAAAPPARSSPRAVVFVDTSFYAAITPLLPDLTRRVRAVQDRRRACSPPPTRPGTFVGALPGGWLAARVGVRPTVLLGLGADGRRERRVRVRAEHRWCSTSRASSRASAARRRGRARSAGWSARRRASGAAS